MSPTLALLAHPDLRRSRVHARLQQALHGLPGVELHDLYAAYPDYWIDVAAEQRRLRAAQRLVWLHPLHWYGMPALLKLWVDSVLTRGFAHGEGRELQGKALLLVLSTGGAAADYAPGARHGHPLEAFLSPYRQIAAFCGMDFEPPWVFHAAHRADPPELERHATALARHLEQGARR